MFRSVDHTITIGEAASLLHEAQLEPTGYLLDRYNLIESAYVHGSDGELAAAVQILIYHDCCRTATGVPVSSECSDNFRHALRFK